MPVYDVIAKLPGAELPDQWIVRGNHHDAWVNGATDPTSGMVALMAEAKAIGELARAGLRPRRTLVFAAWDGEEQGLIGSTEWAEAHADELGRKAVVYLNGDSNSRGFVGAGGSHALETMVNQVFDDVTDPQKGVSVAARARALDALSGTPEEQKAARAGKPLALGALGSGSDYTPFLQHLGIASLDVRFGGEGDYGQYHSIYDSIDHFERFMDPGYRYGVALAQVSGRIVLRLAQADVLPFDPTPLASTVARYVDEVVKLADTLREETETERWRIEQKVYENVADPDETLVVQPAKDPVPFLNFAPLQNASAALDQERAELYQKARTARLADGAALAAADAATIDAILIATERALLRDAGPARPLLVPPSPLRARLLHRLRRQDAARGARADRAAALGRGGGRNRGDRRRARGRSPSRSSAPRRCGSALDEARQPPADELRPRLGALRGRRAMRPVVT